MNSPETFSDAVQSLSQAFENGTSFCTPFLDALPVSHAAVSTLGPPFGSETVCASDDEAARLDELQIDFGIGPGWDALATKAPSIDFDQHDESTSRWPLLQEAIGRAGIHAVYAFPLTFGPLNVGAVDLYATTPAPMTPALISQALVLADVVATQVVRLAMHRLPVTDDDNWEKADFSRREVHQATGMIIAQMQLSADNALALLRAHAFASGRTVRETAADLVGRRMNFTDEGGDGV
ncbi:GAF and ANTAR domain-containing protein [Diaminobutyricibacter tongyongensis]|uniref:GAF and ANTAR domain-containing protein n=1 Tax=Leifsonia tongyongensis TaxID=1268043 RepID=A0A6L9XVI8_9MICO|nr:GAF and ANTAR domain-containing protein [Diaminobutyricibacter tongyongensis]NEN05429.1 GAF and ANTAR domain-containing protein [Diaminobutyricibacter tongyongensis]